MAIACLRWRRAQGWSGFGSREGAGARKLVYLVNCHRNPHRNPRNPARLTGARSASRNCCDIDGFAELDDLRQPDVALVLGSESQRGVVPWQWLSR